MPSLRFTNPELQGRLLEYLRADRAGFRLEEGGTVTGTEAQWPAVEKAALRVRDSCFRWYYAVCETAPASREFEQDLRSKGLRYETEFHDGREVFLLPQDDRDRHPQTGAGTLGGSGTCSFCGDYYADQIYLVGANKAAICRECIERLYADIHGN